MKTLSLFLHLFVSLLSFTYQALRKRYCHSYVPRHVQLWRALKQPFSSFLHEFRLLHDKAYLAKFEATVERVKNKLMAQAQKERAAYAKKHMLFDANRPE